MSKRKTSAAGNSQRSFLCLIFSEKDDGKPLGAFSGEGLVRAGDGKVNGILFPAGGHVCRQGAVGRIDLAGGFVSLLHAVEDELHAVGVVVVGGALEVPVGEDGVGSGVKGKAEIVVLPLVPAAAGEVFAGLDIRPGAAGREIETADALRVEDGGDQQGVA